MRPIRLGFELDYLVFYHVGVGAMEVLAGTVRHDVRDRTLHCPGNVDNSGCLWVASKLSRVNLTWTVVNSCFWLRILN
jgi:hypothetical protein